MTQQEVRPDNPAGRLYLILTALREAPGTQTIGQAWARALGTSGGGYHRLLDRVGQVYALPFYTRRELEKLPSYDPSQMDWWEDLAKVFAVARFDARWDSVSASVTPRIMGGVRSCARILSAYAPEPVLNDDAIQQIKDDIAAIKEELDATELTDAEGRELVSFIRSRLQRIEDSLDDIPIEGAVGVQQELVVTVGELALKPTISERARNTLTWRSFIALLGSILVVLSVINETTDVYQLAVGALKQLGPPTEDARPMIEQTPNDDEDTSTANKKR